MKFSLPLPKMLAAIAVSALVACSPAETSANSSSSPAAATNSAPTGEAIASSYEDITSGEAALMPGQHCYEAVTDTLDAAIRLTVAADGQVTGNSVATISDDANNYYTSYSQELAGTLSGSELALEVTTQIENDVQTTQETWILEGERLDYNDRTFRIVECEAVKDRFTDLTGAESEDPQSAPTYANTQRVEFAPGTSSTVVSNAVVRGDRDLYVLKAQESQVMVLSITAVEDNAVFDLVSPDGKVLVQEGTEEEMVLPETGDYQVIVGGTRGNASYDLTIAVR